MVRVGSTYVVVITTLLLVHVHCLPVDEFDVHSVPLANGAKSGVRMPIVGIGTGGYGPPGETWDDSVAEKAVAEFLSLGGRRIDTSLSYGDQRGIARAVKASKLPRESIFITSKVGGGPPGYNETLQQMDDILEQFGSPYVDLLLIHWPGPRNSSDPECNKGSTESEKARSCRQATWRAMETILQSGKAKAIGVSNFAQNHLQDIIDMNSTLPAVNQVEFQLYWHEFEFVAFCQLHNITFNGYSPLGCPDWAPYTHNWPGHNTTMQEPLVQQIAKVHNKSPAQIILRWQWEFGIVVNPRTKSSEHMKENLDIFDFTLSDVEFQQMTVISPPKNPKVTPDPHKYP